MEDLQTGRKIVQGIQVLEIKRPYDIYFIFNTCKYILYLLAHKPVEQRPGMKLKYKREVQLMPDKIQTRIIGLGLYLNTLFFACQVKLIIIRRIEKKNFIAPLSQ